MTSCQEWPGQLRHNPIPGATVPPCCVPACRAVASTAAATAALQDRGIHANSWPHAHTVGCAACDTTNSQWKTLTLPGDTNNTDPDLCILDEVRKAEGGEKCFPLILDRHNQIGTGLLREPTEVGRASWSRSVGSKHGSQQADDTPAEEDKPLSAPI
ncbi:hypothetical protein MHYP_G00082540 [Metynnis hypsauchen]